VALLRTGVFALLDVQFVTAHLQRFGTAEIPRAQYRSMLEAALKLPAHFPAGALTGAAVAELLQSSTLTS
jgi:leucyl/phenylalanyl-tRNA---protein transferase